MKSFNNFKIFNFLSKKNNEANKKYNFAFNCYSIFKNLISVIFILVATITIAEILIFKVFFDVAFETETYKWKFEIALPVLIIFFMLTAFTFISYIIHKKSKDFILKEQNIQTRYKKSKIINWSIIITLSILSLTFFIFWYANSFTQALADQGFVLKDSVLLANGKEALNLYYLKAPQQIPLLYFQAMLLKPFTLFTNVDFAMANKIFHIYNIIFMSISFIYLGLIFKKGVELYSNKNENSFISPIPAILLTINFAVMSLITFVYGDIPGFMFITLAIYHLIKCIQDRKVLNYIMTIVFLSLSVTIRANYFVFYIALCLIYILESSNDIKEYFVNIIKSSNIKKNIIQFIIRIACIIAFITIPFMSSKIIRESYPNNWYKESVYPVSVKSYLAMGMSHGSMGPGWFNHDVVQPAWKEIRKC